MGHQFIVDKLKSTAAILEEGGTTSEEYCDVTERKRRTAIFSAES